MTMTTHDGPSAGTPVRAEGGTPPVPAPAAELAGRVTGLRGRVSGGELDRWLLVAGGVLLPLGVLLIVLGWLGAAHTVLLFEQIPYLVSGGMLGLAFVVVGGFVYFAYWQTLLVREGRDQHRELIASLGRIETLLAAQGNADGPAATGRGTLLATPTGNMLHRADCSVVAGRTDLREVRVGTPGFEPCRICQPLG